VRYQVLTAASMKMRAFWDMGPYRLVEIDWRFKCAYCLHRDRPDDGGSTHIWNVSLHLRDYKAPFPRRVSSLSCASLLNGPNTFFQSSSFVAVLSHSSHFYLLIYHNVCYDFNVIFCINYFC
jgi:hypothetical protein